MARVMVTMADRGTATMAAMPLLIMAGTPPRTTTTATLPHTTADIDRVITLPPTMVLGIGVHTHTTAALGTIAGIQVGDPDATLKSGQRKVAEMSAAFFVPTWVWL
jgi:hypothetical protein